MHSDFILCLPENLSKCKFAICEDIAGGKNTKQD
jgi:hypothetical protein